MISSQSREGKAAERGMTAACISTFACEIIPAFLNFGPALVRSNIRR
jgi:hypothetical protein